MKQYNPKSIESKWQKFWKQKKIYRAQDKGRRKYILIEFPYPSGEGLHMGHLRPYVAGDVYSRYWRMRGQEVMYPMGWDAFGLPAENFAIKKGVHPSITTKQNIKNAKRQVQSWGIGFDWSREINTTDPEYYKWTQWIFLQFYKAGLAYEATGLINWCPKDKTGLANEEVIDGRCERCGTVVEKKKLRQWYLKITAYAEKLLDGLKNLPDWPSQVRLQQENWIGKSEGAEIDFILDQPEVKRFVLLHGRTGDPQDAFLPWLKSELEKRGFDVQVPAMPSTNEPNDLEQAEFVKNNCTLDEQTVIIGHSFGGVVAMRLLEQGVKINRAILVGTPFSGNFLDGKVRVSITSALKKGFDFETIEQNSLGFTLLYDLNDRVVPLSDGEALEKQLGLGLFKLKAKESHFKSAQEPEVLSAALGVIKIFTTRPDTIFGATYMVLAPEHPLIKNIEYGISNIDEVQRYIEEAKKKTDIQRSALEKEKTGVELKGVKATNPATGEKIPVWIADYVLMGYGTGAIMAVPAHDERDFQFAKKYKLPIKKVIKPKPLANVIRNAEDIAAGAKSEISIESECYTGEGILINSGKFNGMNSEEAIPKMAREFGTVKTQYKLRDWVFSRQRYWGEPIPLVHCPECGTVPMPEKDLPVKLPNVKKYEPTGTGESPLAAIDKWVNVKCPQCKGPAKRETNTMPQWAGSSWYYLRYTDPKNRKEIAAKDLMKHWLPVDVYFGGMEHTTLHLLYSRFWNLFLHDQGIVPVSEPYTKRVPHGIILAEDGEKMSKSRGNVVNPDEIVKLYGADTLRMYELFLGPHEQMVKWNDKGIIGVRRFLEKVFSIAQTIKMNRQYMEDYDSEENVRKTLHKTIKKIGDSIENFNFNTCISSLMTLINEIHVNREDSGKYKSFFERSTSNSYGTLEAMTKSINSKDFALLLKILSPFAPHIAEDLWHGLGQEGSIVKAEWPKYDEELIKDETVKLAVQVNGKLRATIEVAADASQDEVEKLAKAEPNLQKYLEGNVRKVIYVPGKILNFVIS